jgi:hypothetical protein
VTFHFYLSIYIEHLRETKPAEGKREEMIKVNSKARRSWLMPVILATQEDHSSKPTQANSSRDPISKKKKNHKKRAQGYALSSKLNTARRKS